MKVSLLKIEKRGAFMKRMKETWMDIYENSTMNTQILRDNPATLKVRDENDVEPNVIDIRAIEPIRNQEKTLRRMKTRRKKA